MDRNTKQDQKDFDHKIVDVAYGTASGAAIGAGIGVAAAIIASTRTASIIPIVGAVAGGVAGLFAVGIMTNRVDEKQSNSSKSEE